MNLGYPTSDTVLGWKVNVRMLGLELTAIRRGLECLIVVIVIFGAHQYRAQKFYWESKELQKSQWYKILSSSAWKWSVESVVPSDKNYRLKTITDVYLKIYTRQQFWLCICITDIIAVVILYFFPCLKLHFANFVLRKYVCMARLFDYRLMR